MITGENMTRATALYDLQQIDSEIDARSVRVNEIIAELGESQELIDARKRLQQIRETLAGLNKKTREQDLTLQNINQKKKVAEQRLYSGKIRNPKELEDKQEEVASLSRRKSAIEDKLLEIMLLVEECEEEESEAASMLQSIEENWQSRQGTLAGEKKTQEARLAELKTLRKEKSSTIPPSDLNNYEKIRERRGGIAVSKLVGDECQGCMTSVAVAQVKQAQSGGLAFCDTCRRILYLV
jgi:predicted  nucleic acid-binding Zn-ribbon protein